MHPAEIGIQKFLRFIPSRHHYISCFYLVAVFGFNRYASVRGCQLHDLRQFMNPPSHRGDFFKQKICHEIRIHLCGVFRKKTGRSAETKVVLNIFFGHQPDCYAHLASCLEFWLQYFFHMFFICRVPQTRVSLEVGLIWKLLADGFDFCNRFKTKCVCALRILLAAFFTQFKKGRINFILQHRGACRGTAVGHMLFFDECYLQAGLAQLMTDERTGYTAANDEYVRC